ncbi:histidine-type phosphatase [Clavibacter capsici]|uniref:Multiple inositol polyphosphate phosphatase 1 n=1 Tax=Clavibacter capsici TaxID=1874630 RepID=A0AAE6XNG8_9MICO|nr:histidine-type phosphatase [Clavibacter capsici]ALD11844.1 sortase [Clavibacter capsici]QIS43915.1 histidine-type phosphatase [Clavibacter capsici]
MRLRTRRRLSASVALALALGVAVGGSALPALAATGSGSGTASADRPHYSSKTPYAPQGTPADLAPAPAGFAPVYTESVARHGSRALSSFKYDSLTTQVWEQARSEGALTALGETLGPEVQELTAANRKLGYGNLTGQGADQHRGIGARVVERLPSLFAAIAAGSDQVALESSGEARATASGKAFAKGLTSADPLLASHLPEDIAEDPATLYFHKSDANADYQAYEDGPAVTAAVEAITDQQRSHEVARRTLERIYSPAFVDRLAAGQYHFVDGGDGKTHVDDEVDAAMMLYNLYIIAPDMADEFAVDFDRYITSADSEWFAYLLDAEDFYSKGPAFQGSDITYRMARPLLDDFLDSMDARLAGSSTAATFRFAHAETIIPFAALLGLPGSTQQVTPADPYTYATNAWRGETVTPMAANVQWDVYRDASGRAIVRMLDDERAIPFRAGCTPIAPGSLFYDAGEVRRCLTGSAAADPGTSAPGAPASAALPGSPAEVAAADASAARGDTLPATGMSADELPFLAVLAFALGAAGITAVGVVRRPRQDDPPAAR